MRSSVIGRATTGIVALLLTFAFTACDDEEPSTPPPSESPSAPESSTPGEPTSSAAGPVEPELPSQAQAATKRGVAEFVRYYFAAINYATTTGDVELLSTLDQPSCSGCQGGIAFVERVYRHGGRIVGGMYRLGNLEPVRSPSGNWTITVHTQIGDQRVVGAGKLNRTYPAGRAKWLVGVARVSDAWSVTRLDIV